MVKPIKLYIVALYNLRMCVKEDKCGSNDFKVDN